MGDPFMERTVERERMVFEQIEARGIHDSRVIAAMRRVPRHAFVPPDLADQAYDDGPLPIGHGQTISQPFVVAAMTEALMPALDVPGARVLEIGAGSGYQTAVLAELVRTRGAVTALEIVPELAEDADARLAALGYDVDVRCADGALGCADGEPWQAVLAAAAPLSVPERLMQGLAVGGRIVMPVGGESQTLVVIHRTSEGWTEEALFPVRFVPMTGST